MMKASMINAASIPVRSSTSIATPGTGRSIVRSLLRQALAQSPVKVIFTQVTAEVQFPMSAPVPPGWKTPAAIAA